MLYSVLHPDVFWYPLNGIGTKTKMFSTCFSCIFSTRTKWNILQILQKQISFQDNMFPQRYRISIISRLSAPTMRGLQLSPNHAHTKFKKTVYPRDVWMWHNMYFFYVVFVDIQIKNRSFCVTAWVSSRLI